MALLEVSELLDWYKELSDELVARTREGRATDQAVARLLLRMRVLTSDIAERVDALTGDLPALVELRDHARAIDVLLGRALEMYPVVDTQAVGMAGEHAAYLVAAAEEFRKQRDDTSALD